MGLRISANTDAKNNVWYLEVVNVLYSGNFDTERDMNRAITMLKRTFADVDCECNIEVVRDGEPEGVI